MKLTLTKSDFLDNWYLIEKVEHENIIEMRSDGLFCSSRLSDADIEGHAEEMIEIAEAIEQHGEVGFNRCAVRVSGSKVELWSPRNSRTPGECTLEEALELAKKIREKLQKP